MRTQYEDSQRPIVAESGISWKLIAENVTMSNVKVRVTSSLRITALADVTVTLDGVKSVFISEGDTVIINAGKGDPADTKYVKVTTSGNVYCSESIDRPRAKRQQPVV